VRGRGSEEKENGRKEETEMGGIGEPANGEINEWRRSDADV